MKQKLLQYGFIEDVNGVLKKDGRFYRIFVKFNDDRWEYEAHGLITRDIWGPYHLQNINQLKEYF